MTSNISSNLSNILSKAQGIVQPFISAFNNIKTGVVNAVNSMFSTISSIFSRITSLISNITSSVSRAVSNVSNAVSGIFGRSISVDTGDLPGTTPMTISTPRSPLADVNMPQLYNGGIMTRDTLVGNARNSTMSAIQELGAIQQSLNTTSSQPNTNTSLSHSGTTNMSMTQDDRDILYVGTLIADDRGLKELERKLNVIRVKDKGRRG